jgi:hypothetical protein
VNNLTKKDLKKLSEKRADFCVSIYMPTHPYGPETQQAPILLKNLVREIENQLKGIYWKSPDINQLLGPLNKLVHDQPFWERQQEGLALFRSPDEMTIYRLPLELNETMVVSKRFHLKPLIRLVNRDDRFYVLALSLGRVRLFQGNRYRIIEIEVPELHQGIDEALKYDDPERQLQHQTLSHTGGGQPAIHHGHGDAYDSKENALRYFRMVAESVQEVVKNDQAPLILAGLDFLLPIYQEANEYLYVFDKNMPGNPEDMNQYTLHRRAWEILQPTLLQQQEDAIAIYQRLQAKKPQQVSADIKKIVSAAYHGQVDTLLVALGTHKWGVFVPEFNAVELHNKAAPINEDLLDFAAIHTFLKGGGVYPVEPDSVPGDSEIAAVLRY